VFRKLELLKVYFIVILKSLVVLLPYRKDHFSDDFNKVKLKTINNS
jgi:hypothetical protein